MSHSKPANSQLKNSSQASSQALLDELRAAADRARDERLKLARLVKHSASLPLNQQPVVEAGSTPDARFVALSQQVEQLEQAVGEKFDALEKVQQDIDSRSDYLESLRHTITDTTRAFVTQVEQAQHFKAHIDAAKQHVKMSAGRVVDDIRQDLAEYEGPIAKRLEQLSEMDAQIDKRIARMQQMHKQAGEAVDQHLLAALRTAKEEAGDLAGPVKEQVDAHVAAQAKKIEEAVQNKIAELDVDVEEALSPLTSKFDAIVSDANTKADQLIEKMPSRLEQLVNAEVEKIRGVMVEQAEGIVKGLDEKALEQIGSRIHERIAKSMDGYLDEADKQAGGYVDGLIDKLQTAREEAVTSFENAVEKIEGDISIDREQMLIRLDDEVKRLTELVDRRIARAEDIVEGASDGIHRKANAAVESALRVADKKIEDYESDAVDRLRMIDRGIEHGIQQSYERLAEHEKEARKQGQEVMDVAEDAITLAQERLSKFEAGIAQRIANAGQTVEDSIQSIDARMHRVEQDASARVMQIVDLAEESGRSVADSIASLAQSAQATAAKAQADLDEKLAAFENISAEALRTAEQTLRSNISELRDSSRAMIEVVSKQVKTQAADIEPQTIEVINHAEQTMRRRIAELRDGAQSMVELTVSRLEAQLNDVKVRAQQAVFKGIEDKDAA